MDYKKLGFDLGMGVLSIMFILLIEVSAVKGQGVWVSERCLDNTTLQSTANFTLTIDGAVDSYYFEENVSCAWGCSADVHECAPKPYVRNIYLFVIFVVFAGVVLLILKFKRGR